MEDPQPFAGAHVVAAHVALHVRLALRNTCGEVRGADDDRVLGNHRRGMEADVSGLQVDHLIVVLLQVHDAAGSEAAHQGAGLRIQRNHPIAGRDVQDAFLAAVGPVRQPAAGELARRRLGAFAFHFAVHPLELAGRRIQRHDRAPRAAGGIQHAFHHQRRGLKLEFRQRTEMIGLESPGDFELVEVIGVDLIERRVARAPQIAAVGSPLAVGRTRLAAQAGRRPCQNATHQRNAEQELPRAKSHSVAPGTQPV